MATVTLLPVPKSPARCSATSQLPAIALLVL